MFHRSLFLLLAFLAVVCIAGRPFGEDHKEAIEEMKKAGIKEEVAEELFQIESKANHEVAGANGDKTKEKKIMEEYKKNKKALFKQLSKEQLVKVKAFFA
ncbi:hypothetical protein CAEBREN_01525 [Caenorhabditis brenneri]|uniref:SXP/RAL-2 family protein Ani s 5-like cation-binding domain-containing protein n=1 Tax=Caenorhabditis brenneri TaxID=135651 RepID=G0NHC2_CAEBE|nr:hypothetical protein CAEBREN_01525 [Caenorhabditis brenneri]